MRFQAYKRTHRQQNVALLRFRAPHLRPFNAAALLQLAVVVLNGKYLAGQIATRHLYHAQVARCPVLYLVLLYLVLLRFSLFRVAV